MTPVAEHYYLGVDGGGTSCRVRLTDAGASALGEGRAGSASTRLGASTVWSSILAATRQALAAAGLPETALANTHAGLGLAGAITASDREKVLSHPHPFASARVATDAHAAVLGAYGGADGGILIVGTGSCGTALINGEFHNVGGWGFPVSDHGSGAWLGLRALRETLLALEGMREPTPLTQRLIREFGGAEAVLEWQYGAQPRDYAALVQVVCELADAGDPLARTLFETTADEAAMLLRRVIDHGADRVCLLGGLSQRVEPLLPQALRAHLARPEGDAMDGALLIARGSADP